MNKFVTGQEIKIISKYTSHARNGVVSRVTPSGKVVCVMMADRIRECRFNWNPFLACYYNEWEGILFPLTGR